MNNEVDEFYNKHLNILYFYNLKKDCENNLSRVLARLLLEKEKRYEKFQNFFLEHLGLKDQKIDEVIYQRSVSTIDRYLFQNKIVINKCIPVALYGANAKTDSLINNEARNIPDITLIVGDTLVLIEVKLDGTNPEKQVAGQVNEYKKNYNKEVEVKEIIKFKWEKITNYLLKEYLNDFFVKDYIDIMLEHYPHWFEYTFSDLISMIENKQISYKNKYDENDRDSYVNIKIRKVLTKYCADKKLQEHKYLDKRGAFPLKSNFTSEMQLRLNPKTLHLEAHMWTGETCSNCFDFIEYKDKNDEKIKEFINYTSNKYNECCEIRPYILFRDYNNYLDDIEIGKTNKLFSNDLCEIICKRKKYKEYKTYLYENKDTIIKEIPKFFAYLEDIIKKFYESPDKSKNRNYLQITLGYDIVVSYPQEVYFKLEEDGKIYDLIDNSLKIFDEFFEVKH